MSTLLLNIVLAIAWTAVTGGFSPENFALGFLLGLVILLATRQAVGTPEYAVKFRMVLVLVAFFIYELFISNLRVAWDVVQPRRRFHSAILAIPLDARTDTEITVLASLLTLTPGTTSIDVADDRRTLFIHVIDVNPNELEQTKREIKRGFERRILEVTR